MSNVQGFNQWSALPDSEKEKRKEEVVRELKQAKFLIKIFPSKCKSTGYVNGIISKVGLLKKMNDSDVSDVYRLRRKLGELSKSRIEESKKPEEDIKNPEEEFKKIDEDFKIPNAEKLKKSQEEIKKTEEEFNKTTDKSTNSFELTI